MKTIAIIGAGASGLACASTLSTLGTTSKIIVLEQFNKSARKLLTTGNGRCNLSNQNMGIQFYNTNHKNIEAIIASFDPITFFEEKGLLIKTKGELLYPFSNQAVTVKNVLLQSMPNVEIREGCKVEQIVIQKSRYCLKTNTKDVYADYVVYAAGSKASGLSGEDSVTMLEQMQLPIIPLYPSLVQLHTKPSFASLKGVRVKAIVSLCNSKEDVIDVKKGEVLFTDAGVSGICIMQLSRWYHRYQKPLYVKIDMLPDYTKKEADILLDNRKRKFGSTYLAGIFNEKLANILEKEQWHPKQVILEITGTKDYKSAQVMTGGLSLEAVTENLECYAYPNFYVIGEVLDVDGDCGGYNLHFAFASGVHVAKNINDRVKKDVADK